jgi:ParB-like chromosome segregation protein Spo0J
MADTQYPPTEDIRHDDATQPTGEPEPAPADVEASLLRRTLLQFDRQHIPVDKVSVVGARRALQEDKVTALAKSIELIGLVYPILVRIRKDESQSQDPAYDLIAGLHRLEACRRLGWTNIPAIGVECTQLEAELLELDENLCRAELSPAERAKCTARRKALYEQQHPETVPVTQRGGPGRGKSGRQVGDGFSDRFTADTAAKTGQSERAIQRAAERGEKIAPDVMAEVTGSQSDKGVVLDLLKKLDHDEQRQALQRVQSGVSPSFQDAYRFIKGEQPQRPAKPARTPAAPLSDNKARDQRLATGMATKPARQPRLAAAIVDYNVAWPPTTFDAGMAELTDPEKADLRQHLPKVMNKHQQLADYIGLKSIIADEATSADQPSPVGGN